MFFLLHLIFMMMTLYFSEKTIPYFLQSNYFIIANAFFYYDIVLSRYTFMVIMYRNIQDRVGECYGENLNNHKFRCFEEQHKVIRKERKKKAVEL